MQLKEVCRRTGLTVKSIRLYEQQGLISLSGEVRNGRSYRDYTEEDVAELQRIATMRRARFTMAEIHMMQEQPDLVPAIYANYCKRLQTEAAELAQLCRVATAVPPETLGSHEAVAAAITPGVIELPLPPRDVRPNFGRLDRETAAEKDAGIARYRAWYRRRTLLRRLVPAIVAAILVLMTCGVAAVERSRTSDAGSAAANVLWQTQIDSELEMRTFLQDTWDAWDSTSADGAAVVLDENGTVLMTAEPFIRLYEDAVTGLYDMEASLYVPIPADTALLEALQLYDAGSAYTFTLSGNLVGNTLELTKITKAGRPPEVLWGSEEGTMTLENVDATLYLHSSQSQMSLLQNVKAVGNSASGPIWNTVLQYRRTLRYGTQTCEVVLLAQHNFLRDAARDCWPFYVMLLLLLAIPLLFRRYMPGDKSFVVTRRFSNYTQQPMDGVVVRDSSSKRISAYGAMDGGNIGYTTGSKHR